MSGTQKPPPYTDDKSRIVLSFANVGGGDLFAKPPRTTPMQLNKIPGTADPLSPVQHLKGSWVINNSDFQKVSDFVTAHGCPVGA